MGYGASSDDRCLDLFLTQYSPRADEDHKGDRGDIETAFKPLQTFLSRCLSGQIDQRDPGSDVTGMCAVINERFGRVEKIRFLFITNARSVMRDRPPPLSLQGRPVSREVWDLRRLANWATSGSKAEPIVAEFLQGLPCLANVDTAMLHNDALYQTFRPDVEHPTREDAEQGFTTMHAIAVPYVQSSDVSHAVVYLASDESRYVTGLHLKVDAGLLVKQGL